jgi:hypothetical protein
MSGASAIVLGLLPIRQPRPTQPSPFSAGLNAHLHSLSVRTSRRTSLPAPVFEPSRQLTKMAVALKDWQMPGTLAEAGRNAVIAALEHCAYNHSAAAARLAIGRTTLYRLVDRYEIELPTPVRRPRRSLRKPVERGKLVSARVILHEGDYWLLKGG